MRESQANRTTIRLPDKLHRQLKVMAADRGVPMQDLLEAALTIVVEGGLEAADKDADRTNAAVPSHLERVVRAFVDFWRNPDGAVEESIRRMVETAVIRPRLQSGKSRDRR